MIRTRWAAASRTSKLHKKQKREQTFSHGCGTSDPDEALCGTHVELGLDVEVRTWSILVDVSLSIRACPSRDRRESLECKCQWYSPHYP